MIVDAALALLTHVIAPFINHLMPQLALGSLPTVAETVLTRMGGWLKFFTGVIPVALIILWLQVWVVLFTAAGIFYVFDWIWKHLPQIGGTGTGNG